MKPLWVKRTDSSSYFPSHFHEMEKQALETVPGVQYLGVAEAVPGDGDLVLLTNTHTRLPHWEVYRSRTRFILHPNSGFENLLPAWDEVPVLLGNHIRAQAVAEWMLACLFQHVTPVRHHSVWPRTRAWPRPLLRDLRVLVLGHGPVGQTVTNVLAALGCHAQVHDPYLGHSLELHQVWDVVMVAASANRGNVGLLNHAFFALLPDHAVVINAARAELIDQQALQDYLQRCPGARAYLDVHAVEPFTPAEHPQEIHTPHIAGVWHGLLDEMVRFEREVLAAWQSSGVAGLGPYPQMATRLTPQGWYR